MTPMNYKADACWSVAAEHSWFSRHFVFCIQFLQLVLARNLASGPCMDIMMSGCVLPLEVLLKPQLWSELFRIYSYKIIGNGVNEKSQSLCHKFRLRLVVSVQQWLSRAARNVVVVHGADATWLQHAAVQPVLHLKSQKTISYFFVFLLL